MGYPQIRKSKHSRHKIYNNDEHGFWSYRSSSKSKHTPLCIPTMWNTKHRAHLQPAKSTMQEIVIHRSLSVKWDQSPYPKNNVLRMRTDFPLQIYLAPLFPSQIQVLVPPLVPCVRICSQKCNPFVTWSRGMSRMSAILILRYWEKQCSNSFVMLAGFFRLIYCICSVFYVSRIFLANLLYL